MKVCEHPDCRDAVPRTRGPGRPALYCPRHQGTKYAMQRSRKHPELRAARIVALPPCCRPLGRTCPQHLAESRYRQQGYRPSAAERAVISELLDVWGHASIWNDRGWNVYRVLAPDDSDSW